MQIHCMVHMNIIGALNPASCIVIGTMVSFSRLYTENKNLKQELVLVQVFLTLRVWFETTGQPVSRSAGQPVSLLSAAAR